MLRKVARLVGLGVLLLSTKLYAFEVIIQGKRLIPKGEEETCINILGAYPGVKALPSEAGKTPQICFSDSKRDILSIHNVTFVAIGEPREVVIDFQHSFPPGPNGYVMARTKLKGFFATATGLGVPTGDKIQFSGYFSQGGQEDLIAETFKHTVGEDVESALIDKKGKKRYLIAGPRTLKAKLQFSFTEVGHKLTLPTGTTVSIDMGARFEDKLEEMGDEAEGLLDEAGSPEAGEENGGGEEAPLDEEFTF